MKKCLVCGKKLRLWFNKVFDDRYGAPGFYKIYRCLNCGFGRLEPALNSQKIGQFYAKYYPLSQISASEVKKNVDSNLSFKNWFEGTDNVAHKYITGGKVLDIGSASGQSLLEIAQKGGSGVGIEPDPYAQKLAKKLKLKVYHGTLSTAAYPKQRFDFITASQVIEHEENPEKFLKLCKQKLASNGQVILAFPNNNSIYRQLFGRRWINWHVPYHCNFFNHKSFQILAARSGFKITKIKTVTPTVWTIQQIRSLLQKNEMGQPSKIWQVNLSKKGKQKPNSKQNKLNEIITFLISLFNRLIDFLGLGDSILVFLESK